MLNHVNSQFETTVNYWMMMERYPYLMQKVGGLIFGCEIPSLFDKDLSGGQLPFVLWCWPVGFLSQKEKKIITSTQSHGKKN